MKKLILLLLIVPFLGYGQFEPPKTTTVKVRDNTIGSDTYGQTSSYQITEERPLGSFDYSTNSNNQTEEYDQSKALDDAARAGAEVGAAIGKAFYAKYGKQLKEQAAREGIKYLGDGKYELIEVLGTGLTGVKGSIKRANKTLNKFTEEVNLSSNNNYTAKKYSEDGKKGGMGVYSEATIVFELVDKSGNIYIDDEQEAILQDKKALEEAESNKIEKGAAITKLKEYKELLDLELITQEQYDKFKSELAPIIMGK